jgi:hypothetical protein
LIVTEPRNAIVRLVAAQSHVETRPPAPPDVNPEFDTARFAREPLLWPLAPLDGPFEITGTLGEPRGNEGERFHAGIDVHAAQGTPVRAARAGVVRDPISTSGFGGLNESVRIGPLAYVHVRAGRLHSNEIVDPERFVPTHDETGYLTDVRVKRGAHFGAGETIGSANAFNHVHLNVGWPGEEHNPLRYGLTQFEDTVPPTITRGGVRLFRENGEPITQRKSRRLIVDGAVRVVVDAWDQVDGNKPRRRLGLYRLGYQVLNRDGSAVPGFETPRETLVFDRLSTDSEAPWWFTQPAAASRSTAAARRVSSTLSRTHCATAWPRPECGIRRRFRRATTRCGYLPPTFTATSPRPTATCRSRSVEDHRRSTFAVALRTCPRFTGAREKGSDRSPEAKEKTTIPLFLPFLL